MGDLQTLLDRIQSHLAFYQSSKVVHDLSFLLLRASLPKFNVETFHLFEAFAEVELGIHP